MDSGPSVLTLSPMDQAERIPEEVERIAGEAAARLMSKPYQKQEWGKTRDKAKGVASDRPDAASRPASTPRRAAG